MAKAESREQFNPEARKLTKIQTDWLASQGGVSKADLKGATLGDLRDRLRFVIDPELFLFRRVCGRVVKRDPATGEEWGVPNATVHVEDTDYSFLGFFPSSSEHFWLWPLLGHREEVGHTVTDACGRFCAWVPRWDIDRVLRLRRRRVCLPEIVKPSLEEILTRLREELIQRWPPPIPDPGPLHGIGPETLRAAREVVGAPAAAGLEELRQSRAFGEDATGADDLLNRPAFPQPPAPPLPSGVGEDLRALDHPVARELERLDVKRVEAGAYLGPFLRCHDVFLPEWQTIIDVPDITFRVTQDVDGDGVEETIYSEGFFDVRWDAGEIPPVTLFASPLALATPICGGPSEARECEDKPELYVVDPMPLTSTFHNSTTGYAQRVNRPRDTAGHSVDPPAGTGRTPYARRLSLLACHRLPGAKYQRVMFESGEVGPTPLWVEPWSVAATPKPGLPAPPPLVQFHQGADGWVPIFFPDEEPYGLATPDCVLQWSTPPRGTYVLYVECADAERNRIGQPSDKVAFTVDNETCQLSFGGVEWSESGAWNGLPEACAVIRRKPGATVQLRVSWSATSDHFRNAALSLYGCDRSIAPSSGVASAWYTDVFQTSGSGTAVFEIPGTFPDGAYRLELVGWTRAYHPEVDEGTVAGIDFAYDQSRIGSWRVLPIAIVNADAS